MADLAEETVSLELIVAPVIEKRILVVRERQVMLDEDLADLYGVETRVLVQQVRRNAKRFPSDFMFQLSAREFSDLKSQSVISSGGHGGSYTAIEQRLKRVEREIGARLGEHDEQLGQIFKALRQLLSPRSRPKRPIGFRLPENEG